MILYKIQQFLPTGYDCCIKRFPADWYVSVQCSDPECGGADTDLVAWRP